MAHLSGVCCTTASSAAEGAHEHWRQDLGTGNRTIRHLGISSPRAPISFRLLAGAGILLLISPLINRLVHGVRW